MDIKPLSSYIPRLKDNEPLIISGPCSAETRSQTLDTAHRIEKATGTHVFRAGIWKPRTRPGHFEGIGKEGLKWLAEIKKTTPLLVATEVANTQHLEAVLKNNIDIIWLGARTVSNPFSTQEIANALKGVDIPVFVKNPINPDLSLWAGAIERLSSSGITKMAAVHRGFYPYEETFLRNIPKWEVPIELKSLFNNIPIICDPSHIAGQRDYISDISQKALDLNFDGLMIETHNRPDKALSDAEQQLTPTGLKQMLDQLVVRRAPATDIEVLHQYRNQIDSIDQQMLELLSQRMGIINNIGKYKLNNNISIFQLRRWENILKTRTLLGQKLGLDKQFIKEILQLVHKASIQVQNRIMNKE